MNDRLIISIYDYTGAWAKPYRTAGYPIILWDKKIEGCILNRLGTLISLVEESELKVHGILFAPPCTDFSLSGARWWPEKDKPSAESFPFTSSTEEHVALALICLVLVDLFNPVFWALENPVGRLEKLVPEMKPYRRMTFQPCDYGDPYTKRTILWGDFNTLLPQKPVTPHLGSLMHQIGPGKKRAEKRSATPMGFARAFFNANQ